MEWRAVILMVAMFIVGIAFALGHHFYYTNFNGQVVQDTLEGDFDLESQQRKLQFSTAFAFLTKAALVASLAIAY